MPKPVERRTNPAAEKVIQHLIDESQGKPRPMLGVVLWDRKDRKLRGQLQRRKAFEVGTVGSKQQVVPIHHHEYDKGHLADLATRGVIDLEFLDGTFKYAGVAARIIRGPNWNTFFEGRSRRAQVSK